MVGLVARDLRLARLYVEGVEAGRVSPTTLPFVIVALDPKGSL